MLLAKIHLDVWRIYRKAENRIQRALMQSAACFISGNRRRRRRRKSRVP